MSITDRAGMPSEPARHALGGFEERLLAELKFMVTEQVAADPLAVQRISRAAAVAPHRSRTRVRLTWRVKAGMAVAGSIATAAAVLALLLPGGPSTGLVSTEEQPLGSLPSHAARPVLLAMAVKAGSAEAGSGRYWCTEMIEGALTPIGPGGLELTPPGEGGQPSPASDYRYSVFTRDRMVDCQTPQGVDVGDFYQSLGARPATPADVAAWRQTGSPGRWQGWDGQAISANPGSYQKVGQTGGQAPWGNDLSLPTDPAKLKKVLLTGLSGPSDVATKRMESQTGLSYSQIEDENLFWNLTSILEEPISPAVRSAAFRLLAQVPGAQETPGVRDPQGRTGTAIWWGPPGQSADGFMIIDPATTMLLASEGFAGTPAWVYKPGTMTSYDVWVSAGWENSLPASS
jgi:hypothetical protein